MQVGDIFRSTVGYSGRRCPKGLEHDGSKLGA